MPGSRELMLSALGRALASVGHELNNVMGVVQNYASFIHEGTQDPLIVADAQVIRASAEKGVAIARQLLAFGHPREHDPEALELGAFVVDMHGFLRRILGEVCPVTAQVASEPSVSLVRRAELARMVLDLALAMTPSFAAGTELVLGVRVTSRVTAPGARLAELWLAESRARPTPIALVAAAVPEALDVAWIEAALHDQGGTLQLSVAADGARKCAILLPVLETRKPSATPPSEPELARARSAVEEWVSARQVADVGSRVLALVVDDDADVRLALSRILADSGADVVTAPSGLHALQKLNAMPIDLVIADQLMPGMEGTRLLETVYGNWPRIARVVYTGYLSPTLVIDAVNRARVHKVLAKDMEPAWLRQQLAEVIAEIRRAREA